MKGETRDRPLTLADLPFTVPRAGRYWLRVGQHVQQLPHAPKGSVLSVDAPPAEHEQGHR